MSAEKIRQNDSVRSKTNITWPPPLDGRLDVSINIILLVPDKSLQEHIELRLAEPFIVKGRPWIFHAIGPVVNTEVIPVSHFRPFLPCYPFRNNIVEFFCNHLT